MDFFENQEEIEQELRSKISPIDILLGLASMGVGVYYGCHYAEGISLDKNLEFALTYGPTIVRAVVGGIKGGLAGRISGGLGKTVTGAIAGGMIGAVKGGIQTFIGYRSGLFIEGPEVKLLFGQ